MSRANITNPVTRLLCKAAAGERLSDDELLALIDAPFSKELSASAQARAELLHGKLITYSPKVFIPLTQLCRDVCHYCTFATTPRKIQAPFLSLEQCVAIATKGANQGCHEALFTLGDRPEVRYRIAREWLHEQGYATTIDYLVVAAQEVSKQTGLLAHVNPGVLTREELTRLREVAVSGGLMLESISDRLCQKGQPHYRSPDKKPAIRLHTLELAGEIAFPFTTGILIGIGESRRERIQSLLAIRVLAERYGHIQEVIVQNFRAKANTAMANATEPSLSEHLWCIAVTRLALDPTITVQAPPNLQTDSLEHVLSAGINDWGGLSPVTPDHVNPEAPWPPLDRLRTCTEATGRVLAARLAVYPRFVRDRQRWLDSALHRAVLARSDADGLAREDTWYAGKSQTIPWKPPTTRGNHDSDTATMLKRLDDRLSHGCMEDKATSEMVAHLLCARGAAIDTIVKHAHTICRELHQDRVTYVVNRNINYTNVCYFKCFFCAFSKGRLSANLRGAPYDLDLNEIARRTQEAWQRGATEVCLQGGIHPDYDGHTYLRIVQAVNQAAPDIHIHAFSPLEIWQGATTLGIPVADFLRELRALGLASLPGTAAEVLDDEVRAMICPDKITTAQWLEVMECAHEVGLGSTATIMFGHVDAPLHWARHLLRVRALQARTGGFTEFVPLPYVHMESPLYLRGQARRGPTWREAVLIHAVARIVLNPLIKHIQASWVKLGEVGAAAMLHAGVDDLGGTLMNESITRAAGAEHGQEMPVQRMNTLIEAAGRIPRQRTTSYQPVSAQRLQASLQATALAPLRLSPAHRYERNRKQNIPAG